MTVVINNIRFIFVLLVGLLLFSCSNNEVNKLAVNEKSKEVKFFMAIARPYPVSRTNTDIYMNSNFIKGDSVGIFVYERNSEGEDGELLYNNVKYVYDGLNWASGSEEKIMIENNQSLNYYVYFPYKESNLDPRNISHEVAQEQNIKGEEGKYENYTGSDFLHARDTESSEGTTGISLYFTHAMSSVIVKLKGTLVKPDMSIQLVGVKNKSVIDLSSGMVTATENSSQDLSISMLQTDNTLPDMLYSALIPSQDIGQDILELRIYVDENTQFNYSFDKSFSFQSGMIYIFDVELNEPMNITVSDEVVIIPWEKEEGDRIELIPQQD